MVYIPTLLRSIFTVEPFPFFLPPFVAAFSSFDFVVCNVSTWILIFFNVAGVKSNDYCNLCYILDNLCCNHYFQLHQTFLYSISFPLFKFSTNSNKGRNNISRSNFYAVNILSKSKSSLKVWSIILRYYAVDNIHIRIFGLPPT